MMYKLAMLLLVIAFTGFFVKIYIRNLKVQNQKLRRDNKKILEDYEKSCEIEYGSLGNKDLANCVNEISNAFRQVGVSNVNQLKDILQVKNDLFWEALKHIDNRDLVLALVMCPELEPKIMSLSELTNRAKDMLVEEKKMIIKYIPKNLDLEYI
jgi:hypothetical protein